MMKGVMLGIAPAATLVDLTHEVPAQDVRAGALLLATAVPYFPPGTIHVAVVDPGVGSRRRALLVETREAFFLGPDNGVLSAAAPARAVVRTFDISRSRYRLIPASATFHGRDVFAPVAARLATAIPAERLGAPTRAMVRLRLPAPRRRGRTWTGEVLWVDCFGNLITNLRRDDLAQAGAFRGRGVSVTIEDLVVPLRRSYAAAPAGRALALVNSAERLEVAVNRGSAAALLDAGPGTRVTVRPR